MVSSDFLVNQFLSFKLGNERYGINIINTREVLETTNQTVM